jgi:hypothetical protein
LTVLPSSPGSVSEYLGIAAFLRLSNIIGIGQARFISSQGMLGEGETRNAIASGGWSFPRVLGDICLRDGEDSREECIPRPEWVGELYSR